MPELSAWARPKHCWCCGCRLPVPPGWWRREYPDIDYCDLCDGPEGVRTCPPHVCEKNDRRIPCDCPEHLR